MLSPRALLLLWPRVLDDILQDDVRLFTTQFPQYCASPGVGIVNSNGYKVIFHIMFLIISIVF